MLSKWQALATSSCRDAPVIAREGQMKAKQLAMVFCALMIVSLISSCGPGQLFGPTLAPTPTYTPVPTFTLTPTITPIPTLTLTPTAAPKATTGQVEGVLLDRDTGQPIPSSLVLLGPVQQDGNWTVNIAGKLQNSSDDKGSFLIKDVPPGKYVVLILEPVSAGSSLTTSPMTLVENDLGETLVIEVATGQIIDIGTKSVTRTPPTPNPTIGGVKGILIDKDTQQPIANAYILLLVVTDDGMWQFDFQNSPRGQSDDKGAFIISDVTPGTYGILVFENSNTSSPSAVVSDNAGKELIIKVAPGQVSDIGITAVKLE